MAFIFTYASSLFGSTMTDDMFSKEIEPIPYPPCPSVESSFRIVNCCFGLFFLFNVTFVPFLIILFFFCIISVLDSYDAAQISAFSQLYYLYFQPVPLGNIVCDQLVFYQI